jgi:nucleoside-diphosphate-sugar epimerase
VRDVPVVPAAADDVREVVLDAAATTAAFGWRAKVSFADTIGRQLRWYDAHGISDVHSHLRPAGVSSS